MIRFSERRRRGEKIDVGEGNAEDADRLNIYLNTAASSLLTAISHAYVALPRRRFGVGRRGSTMVPSRSDRARPCRRWYRMLILVAAVVVLGGRVDGTLEICVGWRMLQDRTDRDQRAAQFEGHLEAGAQRMSVCAPIGCVDTVAL